MSSPSRLSDRRRFGQRPSGAFLLSFCLCSAAVAGTVSTPAPPDPDAAARQAVADGDATALRLALEAGGRAEQSRKFGVTLLMQAAERGSAEIVDLLVAAGASVASVNSWNETALAYAVRGGTTRIVARLLEAGAEVDHAAKFGFSPLIVAIGTGRLEVVRQLLAAGADPNRTAEGGAPPLHFAAHQGHLDIVRALLDAGARLDARDESGRDALTLAAEGGHEETIRFLEKATGREAPRRTVGAVGTLATDIRDVDFRNFSYRIEGRPVEVHEAGLGVAATGDLAVEAVTLSLGDLNGDGAADAAVWLEYRTPDGAERDAVIVFGIRDGRLDELGRLPASPTGTLPVSAVGIDAGRLTILRRGADGAPRAETWQLAAGGLAPVS